MLTILGPDVKTSRGFFRPMVCHCGTPVFVRRAMAGTQQSCGCGKGRYKHGASKRHEHDGDRLYSIWSNMRQRCANPRGKSWENYGGRGITVCSEWDDFVVFRAWAVANGYAVGLTLDRRDNDGDYTPANCQWSTWAEQSRNRRSNLLFTRGGETKTLKEWTALGPVPYSTVYARVVKSGWDIERALTQAP